MFILRMQTQLSNAISRDILIEMTGKVIHVGKVSEDDIGYDFAKNKYCLFVADFCDGSTDSMLMGTFNTFNMAKNAMGKIYTAIAAGEQGTRVIEDNVE